MNNPDIFFEFQDEFANDPTLRYLSILSDQSRRSTNDHEVDLSRITHEISRLSSKLRKIESDMQNISRDMYRINLKLDTIIDKLQ